MSERNERMLSGAERRVGIAYEAPRVERVLTPAELEDEILYAGFDGTPPVDG